MKSLFAAVFSTGLLVTPAFAQSGAGTWNDLPDRYRIDTGYFRVSGNTLLHFNSPRGTGDVDFEKDLDIPQNANTFWVDGIWRVGRRHQVELSFTRLNRDRDNYTLTRDFQWGGQTYNRGLSATSTTGADILGGYYRFAAFRNERFEIGPTVGIGGLWLRAGIKATGTITGPGGTPVSRTLDETATKGHVTGAVGAYLSAWPAKRLVVRSDFLYIKVSPGETDASVTDWRAGADYYFVRHAGVGVQYKYNKYTYNRSIVASELGGEVRYEGFQVFASFLF